MNLEKIAQNVTARVTNAGCEKLPEGAMRDNCEKKKKDKKAYSGLDAAFRIEVEEDAIDGYELEDLAERYLDDAAYDNFDIYSDDKRGLEQLRRALEKNGVSVSRVMRASKGEVPEAFKKEWKNKDKDNDGKENEPKPEFLKDKESSMSDRIADKLIQGGCEKLPEGPMRDNCEKKKKEGKKREARLGPTPYADAVAKVYKMVVTADPSLRTDRGFQQAHGDMLDAIEDVESLLTNEAKYS